MELFKELVAPTWIMSKFIIVHKEIPTKQLFVGKPLLKEIVK